MKLTLIRHSKTKPTNDIPIPLWGITHEGIELCEKLSETQAIKDVDVMYASLETKAIETEVLLSKNNSIQIRTEEDLEEVTSFTKKFYTGDEFAKNVDNFYGKKVERIGEGESVIEALTRFNNAIDDIIRKEGNAKNIGIVSHGGILSLFSEQFYNLSALEMQSMIKMPDVAILDWDKKVFLKFWGEVGF